MSVKYKFAKKVNYSKCLMSATLPSPDLCDSEAKVEFVSIQNLAAKFILMTFLNIKSTI